jgi:hypothetical protein
MHRAVCRGRDTASQHLPASKSYSPSFHLPPSYYTVIRLTDDKVGLLNEVILGHLKVERRRALPDTARNVVVRTVARAEPATEVTGLTNGHTTQVGAHTNHDEPLGLLDALAVLLRVAKSLPLGVLGLLDLVGGTVANEDGLAAPLDDNVLALGDGSEVDLDLGLGQDVGGCGHVDQEVCIWSVSP